MKEIKYLLILLLFIALASCGGKNKDNDIDSFKLGFWGQLAELESISSTPMYLIYIKPTDVYRVCVASHLLEEHAQFLTQVDAAIKIWGKYINRDISTEVYSFKMEAPITSEDQEVTFKNYTKACPNADLALGYGNIDSVGLTAAKYSTYIGSNGSKVVQDSSKVIFLQNPAKSGRTWESYFTKSQPQETVEQVITQLMKRDKYQFLVNEKALSTMMVLMHEFGHVWGLCDMYPLGGGHTNCDPTWSKKDNDGKLLLTPHATMAAAGWKNPLFLHDDDIEGIRTLAARTKFKSEWQNQETFSKLQSVKDAEFFFQHKISKLTKKSIEFNFALYNKSPISISISLMSNRGPLNFQPMKLTDTVDTPMYTLNLGYPSGLKITHLEVVIKNTQGDELARHQESF